MALLKDKFELFQAQPKDYGPKYNEDLMEQYKLYAETTDKISDRRSTANTFFLTANTLLVSVFGAIVGKDASLSINSMNIWFLLFALSGLAFSLTWFYMVESYSQANAIKFGILHEIERNLPLALYKAEYIAVIKGLYPYRPLTSIEKVAPLTFSAMYMIILLINIYNFARVYN